jgi:Tol biopolymer transport system component/DNA-binding winged helix-turn-helix (wHTH) protein
LGDSETNSVIRFGTFEVDPLAGELRRNGSRVRLQDQPLQVLLALLERPGEVVTREELRSKLWPADTFVDFDHGLNAAVKRLRDALGDSADNPRFIETLAKRGYRFLLPLNGHTVTAGEALALPPQPGTVEASWTKRPRVLLSAGLGLLAVGIMIGYFLAHRLPAKPRPTEQRLTVNAPDVPIMHARISPDAQYLAYSDRNGLFVRVIATGETHALTLPSNFAAQPSAWFPDNRQLLVTRWSPPGQADSIWTLSVFGGNPKQIMENGKARAVSWDGARIAFVRGDVAPQTLWVMNADGSHAQEILGQSGDYIGAVAWSPDNRKLAFVRYIYQPGFYEGQGSLGIYDFATGTVKYLLYDPGLEESVAWTKDDRVIYSLYEPRPNNRDSNVWAVPVDPQTGGVRGPAQRLTEGPDRKVLASVSEDGKALSYLRVSTRSHIFVAPLGKNNQEEAAPARMSLDEGNNFPFSWTPDGQSVIFVSDRDGTRHLYKQGLNQPTPDLLVGGDGRVMVARISPDRSEILYVLTPGNRADRGPVRVMAMPVNGGSQREILHTNGSDDIQCSGPQGGICLAYQPSAEEGVYSAFDPKSGAINPAISLKVPFGKASHSLSPDGKTLAVAAYRRGKIPAEVYLYSLRDNSRTTIKIEGWGAIEYLDWNPDGKSFWVSAVTPKNLHALVRVDLKGNATPLYFETENQVGWGIPSLDGSHIAYWKGDASSNAWLVRDF